MASFTKYRLADICEIQIGKTPRRSVGKYWGEGHPWVSISDMRSRTITETKEQITNIAVEDCGCKMVAKGTILLSFKLSIGKVAFAGMNLFTNEAIAALPIKRPDLIHPNYLYYALKNIPLTGSNNAAKGSTLNKESLRALQLPAPKSLDDQSRIADILGKVESLIEQRKESLRLLDEFLKSTFLEMFGDPVRNEKGWKKVRLSEICSKIGSGATPRGGKESYKSEGIKLIRSMNVHNNTFIFDGLVFIDEAQASKLDHVIVKPNDVLLNITGASVGRCCLAPKEVVPARVNQHVSIIRPDSNVINPVFLSRVLTNTHFQAQIVKEAKLKGATREAITKEEIERMEVPLPNKRFQSLFATIVEKTELLKARQQHSLKELSTLYGSLSQRAFQGELDLREEPLANAAEPEVVYHKARK